MSKHVGFYVPLNCVTVENPAIVPFLLHGQWFGQWRPDKNHWLVVKHCWNNDADSDMGESLYHTILGARFSDGSASLRKATLYLEGEAFFRDRSHKKTYANLWMDLGSPRFNCGITLSPVPFGPDGKPQIPADLPGFKKLIGYFVANPDVRCVAEDITRIIGATTGSLEAIHVNRVHNCLQTMKIIQKEDGGLYRLASPPIVLRVAFGV